MDIQRVAGDGFELVIAGDKLLLKTSLQCFLLKPTNFHNRFWYSCVLDMVRHGQIRTLDQLFKYLYNPLRGECGIEYICTVESRYVET